MPRQQNRRRQQQQQPFGYQQQQQQQPFGYQQQQHQPYGYHQEPFGFVPNRMPINWQYNNGWSGGYLNEQQQMPFVPLPPPPFYYPVDTSYLTAGPSRNPRLPKRGGILKKSGQQRNKPTPRRLVHFMPKALQQSTQNNNNNNNSNVKKQPGKRKSPEKAHLDTLRRKERRQKSRASLLEQSEEVGCLDDNRFVLLSEPSESDESEEKADDENSEVEDLTKQKKTKTMNKNKNNKNKPNTLTQKNGVKSIQANTTTAVPANSEHVDSKKTRGKHPRTVQVAKSDTEHEYHTLSEDEHEQGKDNKSKRNTKTYLQSFKVITYLKNRMNAKRTLDNELKDAFNEVSAYAKNTIEAYEKLVRSNYDVQVWKRFYELGRHKDHWAKEIVNCTHTREAKTNISFCEKKISHFTSECFDANEIITQNMRELSSNKNLKLPTVVVNRTHDLLLDYVKETTENLSKMSMNRIRRASIEKDEWDTLKAFENVASEQQKIYAKTYCKSTLKAYQKKKKTFDIVAAHISYDIVPKIMPQYDFQLPLDVTSLTSEQTRENKESIHKLSRDFRLKATELYLKIAKEESEFQYEKLEKLLNDFPQDKDGEEVENPPSPTFPTVDKIRSGGGDKNEANFDVNSDNEDGNDGDGVYTQKAPLPSLTQSLTQRHHKSVDRKGLELFKEYIEYSLKRTFFETEKEILFLAERSVQETPFEIPEAQVLTPVLRKDFVLQA